MSTADARNTLKASAGNLLAAITVGTVPPGAGTVAALAGALAAALAEVSAASGETGDAHAGHEARNHLARRLRNARRMFQALMSEDIDAFNLCRSASVEAGAPQSGSEAELAQAAAINVLRETAKLSLALLEDLRALSASCARRLMSGLQAAAALTAATVRICQYGVWERVDSLPDREAAQQLSVGSHADTQRAMVLLHAIEDAAARRAGSPAARQRPTA
jgi:formiminotetrahydrofolate cyclodeaminase